MPIKITYLGFISAVGELLQERTISSSNYKLNQLQLSFLDCWSLIINEDLISKFKTENKSLESEHVGDAT